MNDPVVVGVLQGVTQRRHDREGFARREAAGVEELAQVHAVHEFHENEVASARRGAEFVERDDARVIELGERTGLAREALGEGRIGVEARAKELESGDAVERALPGFVHRAHAAVAEELKQFELGKFRREFRRGRGRRGAGGRRGFGGEARGEQAMRADAQGGVGRNGTTALRARGGG